jgi:hypothetical protein
MLGQVSAVVLDEAGKREQRRADLENYLKYDCYVAARCLSACLPACLLVYINGNWCVPACRSAVEAVLLAAMEICDDPADVERMLARRQRLLNTLAEFLDNEHRRLLVVSAEAVAAAPQPSTEEEDLSTHTLQSISNALGL